MSLLDIFRRKPLLSHRLGEYEEYEGYEEYPISEDELVWREIDKDEPLWEVVGKDSLGGPLKTQVAGDTEDEALMYASSDFYDLTGGGNFDIFKVKRIGGSS